MILLDGKLVAQVTRDQVANEVKNFVSQNSRSPGLAVILVGDDPASQVYVRNKLRACEEAGFLSIEERLPKTATFEQVAAAIQKLNRDTRVDGILLQLPLPGHLNANELVDLIDASKDCDGLTLASMGRLYAGREGAVPCTPNGVIRILQHYQIPMAGQHAVVVGRSLIVGQPMAQLLLRENATVTICHSRTKDLTEITRRADIVVVAAGRPEFLGAEAFSANSVVVDVGIHRLVQADGKTKLVGDVKFNEVQSKVRAITPVPGGVGPMTIAMLLENTLKLAERRSH